jgi:hypothetical protein
LDLLDLLELVVKMEPQAPLERPGPQVQVELMAQVELVDLLERPVLQVLQDPTEHPVQQGPLVVPDHPVPADQLDLVDPVEQLDPVDPVEQMVYRVVKAIRVQAELPEQEVVQVHRVHQEPLD